VGIMVNLSPLIYYKYFQFFIDTLLLPVAGFDVYSKATTTAIPIGISFFTFQAISYLVDIHRQDVSAERDVIAYGAYKSLFPQLIAGPIVRYRDVRQDLHGQRATLSQKALGVERFVSGLAKKVLIADVLAIPADRAFALGGPHLTTQMAWAGIICYALQIYFDFSGYSDMAIGMGTMLGIRFPENFNHPYTATSLRDFWRRWHISLSSWFRDYLYIPLGGNRGSTLRTTINLSLVFLLCGLWHGANWTFLAWGAVHGAFLVCEHFGLIRTSGNIGRCYCMAVVLMAWVLFRSPSLAAAGDFYWALLGHGAAWDAGAWQETMGWDSAASLIAGVFIAWGGCSLLVRGDAVARRALGALGAFRLLWTWARIFACTCYLIGSAYSPFIYFRF
jgi:alginate O-acetyltransferase complex protein AlgI